MAFSVAASLKAVAVVVVLDLAHVTILGPSVQDRTCDQIPSRVVGMVTVADRTRKVKANGYPDYHLALVS